MIDEERVRVREMERKKERKKERRIERKKKRKKKKKKERKEREENGTRDLKNIFGNGNRYNLNVKSLAYDINFSNTKNSNNRTLCINRYIEINI